MNLVERLNARFNNVIHDGLALVGAVVDPWLAKLERQAMSNALGRDFGLDYADGLAAAEAEEEVHEPGFVLLDEFMELGEFLDSATAEELAAMRQQREVSEDDLTMRIADLHGWSVPSIVDSRIARALLETYHITPK
ncbi:hypothetical protein I5H93_gp057 [Mycobacterium phage SuperGrey]|uniref:Uncharacterized protein n=5 Tax=Cheoctovirus TaxID=1623281 RepID=G1DU33_9CAUD|nr:hypothetical protein FDI13_gp055 [Mycobacterium phage Spartacus]YP_009608234.1 hypothetical protein FDI16_gp052 [Mycobacterium phage Shauna1]YP_009962827.1 hypothetical protein I5H93_gp057 [Mycobacterium phage SuperGrey]YP_009963447.1 hypothetical protein I5H99_gp054 [Mycobacterium phage WillSterrel]QIQ63740.1 hypothetical protein SEA_PHANPHAGIA_51 [Mycobacterium phage Phanphagia]AEJ93027.1 hypothetical protein SHAUNA1_52 [Mycobacterium phage Shauna1]AFA45063.1 hypothetical protein SPARTAC